MAWHLECYNAAHEKPAKQGFKARYTGGKCGAMSSCTLGGTIAAGQLMTWQRRFSNGGGETPTTDTNGNGAAAATTTNPSAESTEGPEMVSAGIEAIVRPIVEAEVTSRLAELDTKQLFQDFESKIAAITAPTRIEVKLPSGEVKDCGIQHHMFPVLLAAISARCNVWLAGPAGSGKTTATHAAADALGLPFYDTGAISDSYALFGFKNAQGEYCRTLFREAYENGGVFLQDECDGSDPNAMLALNAALANGHASFPDKMVARHPDCIIVAAANTWGNGATHEYVGRNKIDAAFLDRFAFIGWDYDEQLELQTAPNPAWTRRVQNIRRRIKEKGIRVLCTPRASYIGAQLLASGLAEEEVERMTIRKGMTQDQWNAVC